MQHRSTLDPCHRGFEVGRQASHLSGERRHVPVSELRELCSRLSQTDPQTLYPETLRGDLDRLPRVRLFAKLRRCCAKCGAAGTRRRR